MSSRMANFGFWLSKTFATTQAKKSTWPYVPGTYFVLDPQEPVAITTLGSVKLAEELSKLKPQGVSIIGKVETENIGIEKIIKNIISNQSIRFLLMVGKEPPKHLTGATLKALMENGMNEDKKIPSSPGMRPMLPNTAPEEVERFRSQIELIDMTDCADSEIIFAKVLELNARSPGPLASDAIRLQNNTDVPNIIPRHFDPYKIKLDPEGYFVITPEPEHILVEHYDYKENLVRTLTGDNARDLYLTIVENGWVSKLDHACYIGKELTKAELSRKHHIPYVQDGA
jgi:tetrahydromethanopterin S-methyltransferase subunit A